MANSDTVSRTVYEKEPHWDDRRHFFAAAAEAMRRTLIDNARRKKSRKHGGSRRRRDLDAAALVAPEPNVDLLERFRGWYSGSCEPLNGKNFPLPATATSKAL